MAESWRLGPPVRRPGLRWRLDTAPPRKIPEALPPVRLRYAAEAAGCRRL
jgi:hypothetical protein